MDAANAANAPSFATVRIRMIVDRSTRSFKAASAIVTSCRTNCNQISYFCDGFARLRRPVDRDSFSAILRSSFIG